jgi:U3 small nucleolar RNA-associated protein 14
MSGVSIDDLLSSVARQKTPTTLVGDLKKDLGKVAASDAVKRAVNPLLERRAERQVAYGESKRSSSKWQQLVSDNRQLATRRFGDEHRRHSESTASFVSKFASETPTDLEAGAAAILDAAGLSQSALHAATLAMSGIDAGTALYGSRDGTVEGAAAPLDASKLSDAELLAAASQRAHERARLSYQFAKQSRWKKNKSVGFRKVHNRTKREVREIRQRERFAREMEGDKPAVEHEADSEGEFSDSLSETEEEGAAAASAGPPTKSMLQEARQRMRESRKLQGTAAGRGHTGGASVPLSVEDAMKRAKTIMRDMGEEDSFSDSDDAAAEAAVTEIAALRRGRRRLGATETAEERAEAEAAERATLRAILEAEVAKPAPGPGQGVFGLAFMRAEEERRRAEAKQLLHELNVVEASIAAAAASSSAEISSIGSTPVTSAASLHHVSGALSFGGGVTRPASGSACLSSVDENAVEFSETSEDSADLPAAPVDADAWLEESAAEFDEGLSSRAKPTSTVFGAANPFALAAASSAVEQALHRPSGASQRAAAAANAAAQAAQDVAEALGDEAALDSVDDVELSVGEAPAPAIDELSSSSEDSMAAEEDAAMRMDSASREALVASAFSDADFAALKLAEISAALPTDDVSDILLPGWNQWAGSGVSKKQRRQQAKQLPEFARRVKEERAKQRRMAAAARLDAGKARLVVSERSDKQAAKYCVGKVPHGYAGKQEFDAHADRALGSEWTTATHHRAQIAPEIRTQAGSAIQPIKKDGAVFVARQQAQSRRVARDKRRQELLDQASKRKTDISRRHSGRNVQKQL